MTLIAGYDDDTTLNNIANNVMRLLGTLGDNEGQQLMGLSPARPGHGKEDAIMFTEESAHAMWTFLRMRGVLVVRLRVSGHAEAEGYSLVFGRTLAGLKAFIQKAERTVTRAAYSRRGLTLTVIDDPNTMTASSWRESYN